MSGDVDAQTEENSHRVPTLQQKRLAERRAWLYSRILIPLVFLSLFISILVVALILHQRELTQDPNPIEPITLKERYNLVKSVVISREAKSQPNPTDSDIQHLSTELSRALLWIEIEEAKRSIALLDTSSEEWKALVKKSLGDAVGRQIASSELLLSKFIALQALSPPASDFTDLRSRLQQSVQRVTNTSFSGDSINEISKLRTISDEWIAFYQMRLSLLRLIWSKAVSYSPSDLSLKEALHSHMAKIDTKRNLLVEQAINKTETKIEMELAQLRASRDAQISITTDLRKRISEIKDGTAPQATRTEYEKTLPAMKGLLKPFVSPGYTQPKPSGVFEYGSSKKTMSYAALQRVGALDDSDEGRSVFFQIGGSKSAKNSNDRPLGEFPRRTSELNTLSEGELLLVRKAQHFIRTYGLLMIEDRLLSP